MRWRNTADSWGLVSIALHWIIGLVIIGLFGVGLYMVDLGYTDPLSNVLPEWHRSLGILVGGAIILRLVWRFLSPPPEPLPNYQRIEHIMAVFMHWVLYVLMVIIIVSGYLISTADGRGVSVFDWFEVPAVTGSTDNLEDLAGEVHYWVAWALMVLAGMHALAALKHHFIDRDRTLRRMIKPSSGHYQTSNNNRRTS